MAGKETLKLVANNKKAFHDYFIDETYEAGIALHGTEVKSLRMGKCSIKESFIRIENGDVFVRINKFKTGKVISAFKIFIKAIQNKFFSGAVKNKVPSKEGEHSAFFAYLNCFFRNGCLSAYK